MRILLLGSGAREHALARALLQDSAVEHIYAAPGNPGILDADRVSALDLEPNDAGAVAGAAQQHRVDLVVVGPEAPLVAGVADACREVGVAVFGPSKAAARLEGSKAFAKEIMAAAGVPTAQARACTTMAEVSRALDEFGSPYVVKDDGLAAGKGVVVTTDRQEALDHAQVCLTKLSADPAQAATVVVEEYLDGPEVSLFCLCDGTRVVPLAPAQDFKRIGDDDTGPNTGGMGAYSPLPWAPAALIDDVVRDVAEPVVREMASRGTPFVGLLYCGLALTAQGLRVIEFNVRFGDPETQVVLARLESALSAALYAAATGTLDQLEPLRWSEDAAVAVVLAAEGYPGPVVTGAGIENIEAAQALDSVHVLHAGSALDDAGMLVCSGGRVLSVVGQGTTIHEARDAAYRGVAAITLPGGQYRTDIAAGQ